MLRVSPSRNSPNLHCKLLPSNNHNSSHSSSSRRNTSHRHSSRLDRRHSKYSINKRRRQLNRSRSSSNNNSSNISSLNISGLGCSHSPKYKCIRCRPIHKRQIGSMRSLRRVTGLTECQECPLWQNKSGSRSEPQGIP
mmetsp:Transcript_93233/g.221729  ORF Transcript_93233/g.221729 Transcript_93233/m.221729 type:complete len:138 (+) Transcript_93233:1908-2321(+)